MDAPTDDLDPEQVAGGQIPRRPLAKLGMRIDAEKGLQAPGAHESAFERLTDDGDQRG